MLDEVGTLKETFPTIGTFMGFLPCVYLLVLKQGGTLTETLRAPTTFVGLLVHVSSPSTEARVESNGHPPFLPLAGCLTLGFIGFALA